MGHYLWQSPSPQQPTHCLPESQARSSLSSLAVAAPFSLSPPEHSPLPPKHWKDIIIMVLCNDDDQFSCLFLKAELNPITAKLGWCAYLVPFPDLTISLSAKIHMHACVCISKFWLPKNLHVVFFPVFLVVFGHNLLYWEFKNRYSKKPVYVTKKDISDHIYQLIYISLWFYCSGFGCQNSSKMTTFRPKMRILWHNANSLELLNPENDWPWHCPTTYPKAKKGDISP